MTKTDIRAGASRLIVAKTLVLLSVSLFVLLSVSCASPDGQSVSNQSKQPLKDPIKLSKDQQTVVDELGYPTSFTIYLDTVDGKPIRKEAWRYHGVGSTFMFSNGSFETVRSDLSPAPAGFEAPTVRPNQFGPGVKRTDIQSLLGQPQAQAKIDPNLLRGAKIYQFTGGVTVGMAGDRVVYVEASLSKPKQKDSGKGTGSGKRGGTP